MVETEFSLVRFEGDEEQGRQGVRGASNPLTAEDVADTIAFVVTARRT